MVAGHSLGGIAILGVLDHGLADAVDAVVLVSTVHKRIEPGGLLKAAAVAFLQLASHRTHGIVMMRPGFGRNPHFDDLDELRRNWAEFDGDTLADAAQGLAGFDYTDSLRSCALPTRVICGDADRVTPVKFSREIADLTPDAQLEVLSGVGHMATWEAPSTVVRHICESVYAVVI